MDEDETRCKIPQDCLAQAADACLHYLHAVVPCRLDEKE